VNLRSLEGETFEAIHAAFAEAFSDYIVRLSPTPDGLREMLTRRGWVPELSVGVYDGAKLVAFTLNGFDGTTGYDSGTGVIPSHRRAGLARQTMEWSCTRLRDAGATRYVLEVLEANTPAAALYRDCGFDVTRRLQCWTYESGSESAAPATVRTAAQGTIRPEWCDVEAGNWVDSRLDGQDCPSSTPPALDRRTACDRARLCPQRAPSCPSRAVAHTVRAFANAVDLTPHELRIFSHGFRDKEPWGRHL
jgi:ribosomal protein S18 acetylase RimI-like enzyme